MSTIKYEKHICDICKKEMPYMDFARRCKIAIRVDFGNNEGKCQDSINDYFDVCDDCMQEMGFNPVPVFYKEKNALKNNLTDNIKNIIKRMSGALKKE